MQDQETQTRAERLVTKVAKVAETYWYFHDFEIAQELVGRVWWVINSRYFADRERLMPILLKHCRFAFSEGDVVPDKLLVKAK